MYVPEHFRETNLEVLHDIIEENSFATLISSSRGGLVATHIPVLLDRAAGRLGTLRGHVARANPHWKLMSGADEMLVVFLGVHAYVSPSWYASSGRVPTWNYVAVHAYGLPRSIEDPTELRKLVGRTSDRYEDGLEPPWSVSQLKPEALPSLLAAIVGFEMPITRIEGKRKLGQNRSRTDREAMAQGLRAHGRDDAAAIADLVETDLGRPT